LAEKAQTISKVCVKAKFASPNRAILIDGAVLNSPTTVSGNLQMARVLPGALRRYLAMGILVAAATLLTMLIAPLFGGKAPLFVFTFAVTLAAAYGGLGPGLAATALSIILVESIFANQFVVLVTRAGMPFFAAIGITISVVIERLRRTNAAAERAREELTIVNKALTQRTTALAHANDELERFAYGLAHDLRTPLRTITTLTQLLIERNAATLDENSRECAQLIVEGAGRMEVLIRGLLEYAASVDEPAERTMTDVNRVVNRAMEDLRASITSTGANVTAGPLPVVPASETQLTQVFTNLIGNAVKYRSPDRRPEIHLQAEEQPDHWIFHVRDNGIGLDMQYADHVFGMFKRLHGDQAYEGNGIGLALCKSIVERHGGRIWVDAQLGTGATFSFTLPKAFAGHAPITARMAAIATAASTSAADD
jgi:signal transduction histidine kinase